MAFDAFDHFDALGLAEQVRAGHVTAAELVETVIGRIEALNPKLNAVTIKTYEQARQRARRPPVSGPFAGVPWLAKDLFTSWPGVPSTGSCSYLKDIVPDHHSEITRRTERAGFILVGKTNVPEFGWCLSTEPPFRGVTKNPWDDRLVPGGSSGGSAVAVAAGILPIADASDGAGSIRVPAAINGLVGLKPSRGRITFAPDAADFWHGGAHFFCVSRSVRDSAAFLDSQEGALPGDPYNTPRPAASYLSEVTRGRQGLRIGFSTANPRGDGVSADVKAAVEGAAKIAAELGHHVDEFAFDYDFEKVWKAYNGIIQVETASYFDFIRDTVGRPVREEELTRVIWTSKEKGRTISGLQHAADIAACRMASRQIASSLARFDAVMLPTLPEGTRQLGYYDMSMDIDSYNAGPMGRDNPYMMPFNVSGQPAMSLPLAMSPKGMPIGVQLVGRPADEATLFDLAGQFEVAAPWWHRRPKIHAAEA
jgi:amidase